MSACARGVATAAITTAATIAVVVRPFAINYPSTGGCEVFEETLRQVKTIRSTTLALTKIDEKENMSSKSDAEERLSYTYLINNLGLGGLPIARYGDHVKAVRAGVTTAIFLYGRMGG